MKRRTVVSSMAVVLVTFLFVGSAQAAGPTKNSPVKIGFITMKTGFVSGYGPLEEAAAKFALDEVNWQVEGRKIELIMEDGASNVNTCVDKARKLVELDKVDVIIGPLLTDASIAVAAYLKESRTPNIDMMEGTFDAVRASAGNFFAVGGTIKGGAFPLGVYSFDKLGCKTATLLEADMAVGWDLDEGFSKAFESKGGKVIQRQKIPMGTKDYYPYLVALKKADCVGFFFTALDVGPFVKQYRNYYGREMELLSTHWSALTVPVMQDIADAGRGIIGNAPWALTIDTPENKAFVDLFTKKMGYPPDGTIETNYMAIRLFLEAVRLTKGDASHEAINDALHRVHKVFQRGPVSVSPEGFGIQNSYIVKVGLNAKYKRYDWDVITETTQPIIE
jgi:branched-chain amino acid transport system substrate-binding protein